MQKTQLYIEGEQVELFKDVDISISDSIQDIKDISKVFTSYSQTFNIPASRKNNKILKHYYNSDILNGFDARIKVDATIYLNYLEFKKGYIKLEGVDLRNNKAYQYRLTFFGNTLLLKDLLGDDKLQSLDLTEYDRLYDFFSIRTALEADPNSTSTKIITPLITHTERLIYNSSSGNHEEGNLAYHSGHSQNGHGVEWNQLKYAIRVDAIIEAISVKYGLNFSSDFFNSGNSHYYNLFLWLHRDKGDVKNETGVNESIVDGWTATSVGETETQMINNTTMRVTGDLFRYLGYSLQFTSATSSEYSISLQKDGLEVYNTGVVTGSVVIDETNFDIEQGDYTAYIQSEFNIVFSNIEWDIDYRPSGSDIKSIQYSTGIFSFTSLFEFLISQQIPEITVIDFITGIFKMFNLTAYVDKDTGVVIVKTLDSFYQAGISYDITKYIDVSSSSVNSALPYREVSFEHEDTKTFLANRHNNLFNKKWSEETFNGGQKLYGGSYKVKTPFAQMKYERLIDENGGAKTTIQYGYFVDDDQSSYIGKPLLFYPIKQIGGDTTTLSLVTSQGQSTPQVTYNIPSNSVSLNSSLNSKNMNFYNEKNEYTFDNTFKNTLFESFYKNYITGVFDSSNRLTKMTAHLPLRILLSYNLSDRFIVNGTSYVINSIETNLNTGKSELELLNDLIS